MGKIRKSKVGVRFRSREFYTDIVPIIKVEGKWLEKMGFRVGAIVMVKAEVNFLTIELVTSST